METINGYNVLYSSLIDAQMGPLDRMGFMSITHGSDLDAVSDTVNFSRGGQLMTYNNNTHTFCLPLASGIIGTNLNKMLPIGLLNDLRLEVTWESSSHSSRIICNYNRGIHQYLANYRCRVYFVASYYIE